MISRTSVKLPFVTPRNPGSGGSGVKEYVDFEVILSLLFLRRTTILLCVLASCVVAAAVSFLMPKRYEATVAILAEPRKEDNPYLLDAGSQQERKAFVETQKEIVVSRSVLLPTLIQLREDRSTPVTEEELAAKAADIEEKEVQQLLSQIRVASRSGLGKSLFGGSGIGESSTFFVTMTSNDPVKAADGANRLVRNYQRESNRVRADQAGGAVEELKASVENTARHTREAHAELVQFESETGPLLAELIALDKPTVRVYPELSELRNAYENDKAEAAKVTAEIEGLEAAMQADGEPAIPGTLMLGNPSLSGMKAAIANIQVEINRLAPFYTDESREMRAANEKMNAAVAALRGEVERVIAGHRQYLRTLEAGLKTREASISHYDAQLKKLSESNSRYAELKREYQGRAATLDQQIRALTEARIAATGQSDRVANIAVIDWARANSQPVAPRPLLNILVAFFIGSALGVIVVLAGHFLQPILVHPREVESLTQLPVVAILPVRS